jgi:peptidoglycan/xylan/chitin deacetylase (PgdA/CDA1 family)
MTMPNTSATRYVTLSFDDGFRASSLKTAALCEQFGLRAEFNIVATFGDRDPIRHGDWELWNELAARGHSIQPHGYNHTNKAKIRFEEARDLILRCLDLFAANLNHFSPAQAIFAFPYNASTPEIEAWLPGVVRAFRTGHGSAINPLPDSSTVKLVMGGSEDAEALLDRYVDDLLKRDKGWLVYCAHGLDGEGWGPLRAEYLEHLLDTLVQTENLEVMPARDILRRCDEGIRR